MPKVERITPSRPQPQAGRPAAPAQVQRAATGPRALVGALSVPIAQVRPDPGQPRKDFDDDALGDLADSIRENGILQPLSVRDQGEPDAAGNDVFIIIAGERRWRAAHRAGLTEIPVVVRTVEESDARTRILQLIENLQREDLNIVERSAALKALKVNLGSPSGTPATWVDVAARIGVSKRRVLQLADVAELTEPVQDALRTGAMTEKHTRSMKGLSVERQEDLASVTVSEHLTPDETTAAARAMKQDAALDAASAVVQARTRVPRSRPQVTPDGLNDRGATRPVDATQAAGVTTPSIAPIGGLEGALARLDSAAVHDLLTYGTARQWTCQQLLDAVQAVRSNATG